MIDIVHVLDIYDETGQYLGDERVDPEYESLDSRVCELLDEGKEVRTTTLGECGCGDAVELDSFTNECPNCGQLYNWAGQSLKPMDEWED